MVWLVALVVCVIGSYVSWHLALLHYRTPAEGSLLSNVCTAFAGSSCEKVAQSRWSWMPPLPDQPSAAEPAEAKGNDSPVEAQAKSTEDLTKEREKATSAWYRVPTALLGLFYYTSVLCWLVFTGARPATRGWTYRLFLVGTLLGLAGSAFYELIMWTKMEAWCPLCVVTHAGTLLLVVLALLLRPGKSAETILTPGGTARPPTTPGEGLFAPTPAPSPVAQTGSAPWPTVRVVVLTAVVAVTLGQLERQYLKSYDSYNKLQMANYLQGQYKKRFVQYERSWIHNYIAWAMTPQVMIPVEGRPMRGSPDAPRTMVIFSDFECPHCAYLETFLREKVMPLTSRAPNGGFKIYFKHWPICKDCNDVMTGKTMHPAACKAALATEAARIVGGSDAFWKMHDLLFEHQADWKKTLDFVPYARQIGLNEEAFRKAMDSSEAISRIRSDAADGAALGQEEISDPSRRTEVRVESTPIIFVDGRRLDSWRALGVWRAMLGDGDVFKQLIGVLQSTALPRRPATRPAGPMQMTPQPR